MAEELFITEYDEMLQSKELQIMKSMLPYLDNQSKKTASLFISYITFQKAMNLISKNENVISIAEYSNDMERRIGMLNTAKKFCNKKEQETIDNIINMIYVMDNYENLMN